MEDIFQLIEKNEEIIVPSDPENAYFAGLKTLSEDISHAEFLTEPEKSKILPCLRVISAVTKFSLQNVTFFLNSFFPKIFLLFDENKSELLISGDITEFFDVFLYILSISLRSISNFDPELVKSLNLGEFLKKIVSIYSSVSSLQTEVIRSFQYSDIIKRLISVIRDSVKILTKFDLLDSALSIDQELENDVLKILET